MWTNFPWMENFALIQRGNFHAGTHLLACSHRLQISSICQFPRTQVWSGQIELSVVWGKLLRRHLWGWCFLERSRWEREGVNKLTVIETNARNCPQMPGGPVCGSSTFLPRLVCHERPDMLFSQTTEIEENPVQCRKPPPSHILAKSTVTRMAVIFEGEKRLGSPEEPQPHAFHRDSH